MTHHASSHPRRVPAKPREKGAAATAVRHERRHKSMEGRYGVIGAGATFTDTTWQSNDGGGNPNNYYPGVVLDTNGLTAYNASGVVTMTIADADGSVTVTGSGTITGAVIQTSASNPRTVMNSSGIQSYDNLGNQTFNLGGGQLTVSGQSTITGGIIRTSASNPRVEMNTGGLYAYNSAGTQTVFISSSDGSVTISGNLTVTGTSTITGGTFQTATSNPRVVLNSSGLNAYNASGTNTFSLTTGGNLTVSGTSTITGGTIQTSSGSTSRVIMDSSGIRAYDASGNNTFNLTTSGSLSLYMGASSSAIITLGSAVGGSTGTRVVLDALGIHAYDATNTQRVNIDATSGLITATGIITANPGSSVPWQTAGFFVGGGNILSNASAEDPTSTTQVLYFNPDSVTAGTFALQYGANTVTSALNWNSTAAQVQTALQVAGVLPSGFTVVCSGGPLPATPITITLSGTPSPAPTVLTVSTQSLTGGTAIVGPVPVSWSPNGGVVDWISYPSAFHGGQVFRLTEVYGSSPAPQILQTKGPYGLVPGTSYTLSAYFSAPTATKTAQLIITWLDASGGTVASSSVTSGWSTSSSWQRLIASAKVPVTATRQTISITGSPTAGSFTLTYNGQTTAAINWNATSSQVLSALQALSNVGASGVGFATGGPLPGTAVTVSFISPPAATPASMTAVSSLTGGTTPGVSIATQAAVQVQSAIGISNATQGDVYYIDAAQLEVGDAPTGFKPRSDEIIANSVQANMINVAQLSAISANMGNITAGTITGAVVQSAASGARTVMNSSGFYGYDGSGNTTISLTGATNSFTGTVSAIGLTLPAGFGTAAGRNKVGWTRTHDTALVATLASWTSNADGTGGTFTLLDSPGPDVANSDAEIFLTSNETTGVGNNFARVGVGTLVAILLDDIGRSNFLQLLSTQKLQLALGSVTFTYTAAATSATQVINHGLPGNPRVFFGNVSGTPRHDAVVTAFGTGTFTAEAYTTDNSVVSGSVGFCWIAIG